MADNLGEASPQGNCDAGYLGAYQAQGQGEEAHPGLSSPLCLEADAASGVQGQSPAGPGAQGRSPARPGHLPVGGIEGPFTCLIGYRFAKYASGTERQSPYISETKLRLSRERIEKYHRGLELALKHRKKRFLLRAFLGVAAAQARGFRLRWFVFTESDEALARGLDFGVAQHRFWDRTRYWCPDVSYCMIEHRQGKPSVVTGLPRRNWHCLTSGSDKLPFKKLRGFWLEGYESTISGMEEVRVPERAVFYVVRYLGEREKFVRCWTSHNWVFDGWVGKSKAFRDAFGYFPPKEELVRLAVMSKEERAADWLYIVMEGLLGIERQRKLDAAPFVPVWALAALGGILHGES